MLGPIRRTARSCFDPCPFLFPLLQEAAYARELAAWDAKIAARTDELVALTRENTACLNAVSELTAAQRSLEKGLTATHKGLFSVSDALVLTCLVLTAFPCLHLLSHFTYAVPLLPTATYPDYTFFSTPHPHNPSFP